jgi:protease-4
MDNDSSQPNSPSAPSPPVPPPVVVHSPVSTLPAPSPIATRNAKKGSGWKVAAIIFGLLLFGLLGFNVMRLVLSLAGAGGLQAGSRLQEVTVESHATREKIAIIPVHGVIMGASQPVGRSLAKSIEDKLKLAAKDRQVKAVILRVDSPGGEVLASDDIAKAIERFQQKHNKPVIASMGSMAASGGYYVSAPCRWIVAQDLTMTGSIGVIFQTLNFRGLMNKVGVRPMTYTSGKFKDMLSFAKEVENLTPEQAAELKEEEALVRKMIGEVYERFKSVVANGRNLANGKNSSSNEPGRTLSPKWTDFADGRIISGTEAHELGLVDELGDFQTAVKRALKFAGISEATLVTYQEPIDLFDLFGMLGKSESRTMKLDLGLDVPKLQPGLYYLAPALVR